MSGTRVVSSVVLGLACALVLAAPALGQSGEEVYASKCASCHGAQGEGRGSFPPLADNPVTSDTAYVTEVIEQGVGNMPALTSLEPAEVEAVVAYVRDTFAPAGEEGADTPTPSDEPSPTAEEADGDLPPGSPERGRAHFLGEARLDNGGPACVSCHAAADVAGLGGGTLGSDLTDLAERYGGAAGVAEALANPAFPVMGPAYEDRPLTPQERSDLGAFFAGLPDSVQAETDAASAGLLSPFWIPGALVTALLFVLTGLFWPRTRTGARERLMRSGNPTTHPTEEETPR